MLHFEKNISNKIGLKLRAQGFLLKKELLVAFGIALGLHLMAPFLFTIQKSAPPSIFKSEKIVTYTEKGLFQVALNLDPEKGALIELPPRHPFPYKDRQFLLEDIEANLTPQKSSFKSAAYIKASTSYTLELPPSIYSEKEEPLSMTLRSDEQGKLFWFEWIQKSSLSDLNKAIEEWVKTLTLKRDDAFIQQTLELHLYP